MIRKQFGFTTPKCFFCDDDDFNKNSDGLEVCKNHTNNSLINCPIHQKPMDTKVGKFGSYFYCWECGKTWSKHQVKRNL